MPQVAAKLGQSEQVVLQSHAGESQLQAQAGESSGAESVIFKEHFGGQEASKRGAVGEGTDSPMLHFNHKSPQQPLARILFKTPNCGQERLCEGPAESQDCTDQVLHNSSCPLLSSLLPPSALFALPPSATISHWLWCDSVGCRHWPCLLVCSSVSVPSLEPSEQLLPTFPWYPEAPSCLPAPLSQSTVVCRRLLEAARLVGRAGRVVCFNSASSASVTPGIHLGP
jgi:hypothetical protein